MVKYSNENENEERIEDFIREIYSYKEDRNNPPISECPKVVDLKHWNSFNIVSQDVNYFGYGMKKNSSMHLRN
jgi:hypothetical protein